MEILQEVIKVLVDTLMTIILIIGVLLALLYACGYEPYIVKSGSMSPAIPKGSISFVYKRAKIEDIKPGDVVAYVASTGAKVTHRAINVTPEGIETKGDANNTSDGISTTQSNFIGKNVFSIPKLGYVVEFIQSTQGKIILITTVVVILVAGFLGEATNKGKRSV